MATHQLTAILLSLGCLLSWCKAAVAEETLTLAQDGKSDYTISLPDEPAPALQTAAKELQSFLHEVTGAVQLNEL